MKDISFKSSLIIKWEDIPPQGLDLSIIDEKGSLIEDCFSIASPIKASLSLKKWGLNVKVQGKVSTILLLICDRCAETYKFPVSEKIDVELQPISSLRLLGEEMRLSKEDLEVIFFDGENINVGEIIREQILLSLPMRSLCRKDCKGLCPICGCNLNVDSCHCTIKKIDSPFAILKNLVISSS